MPSMPTRPLSAMARSSARSARQLDARSDASRTARPAHAGCAASRSSWLVPVLPICGAVITTICPAYDGSVTISW